jgi:UDP-N-acetylmuramyl tripeptide synthase
VRLALPGLYNVYNALAAARSRARSARPGRDRAGLGVGRRVRALRADRVGDRRLLLLLIKNPAGANEVVRTLVAAARRARA